MKRLIRWITKKLMAYCGIVSLNETIPAGVMSYANQLIDDWADKNTSGEYKRHQVYASLIKAFPGLSKRDLALAIEIAIYQRGR